MYPFVLYMACGGMIFVKKKFQIFEEKNFYFVLFH